MGQGGAPGRGGEFRRRGERPGLPAAANLSGTLAGVVYSDDKSRRPGGANWRGTRGESERRGRAICRRGGSSVKAGSNGGFKRGVTAGRLGYRRRFRSREEEPDQWVRSVSGKRGPDERGPPVGGGTREGGYPFGFGSGWAEAEMFAGPDLFPVAFYPFFDFFSLFFFCFLFLS
jgi:hypothetical protein